MLVCNVKIDLGNGRDDVIRVRQGDSVYNLAHDFCQRKGLPLAAVDELHQEIKSQLSGTIDQTQLDMQQQQQEEEQQQQQQQRQLRHLGQDVDSKASPNSEARRKKAYYDQWQVKYQKHQARQRRKSADTGLSGKGSRKNDHSKHRERKVISVKEAEEASKRLYSRGLRDKFRVEKLVEEAKEERLQEELKECTFRPQISEFAKEKVKGGRVYGYGLEKEVRKFHEAKIVREHLQRERERLMMQKVCSFQPNISESSREIAERLRQQCERFDASEEEEEKPLHETLFQEAQTRRIRRLELEKKKMYPFHPDIGVDKLRKAQDESAAEFIDRLAQPKTAPSFSNVEEAVKHLRFDQETGQPLFKPQVGRPPHEAWARPEGVSISDYLFYSRYQYADIRDQLRTEEENLLREKQRKGVISESSRRIADAIRENKFSMVWKALNDDMIRTGENKEELQLRCLVELLPELLLRRVGVDEILDAAEYPELRFIEYMMKQSRGVPCTSDLLLT